MQSIKGDTLAPLRLLASTVSIANKLRKLHQSGNNIAPQCSIRKWHLNPTLLLHLHFPTIPSSQDREKSEYLFPPPPIDLPAPG